MRQARPLLKINAQLRSDIMAKIRGVKSIVGIIYFECPCVIKYFSVFDNTTAKFCVILQTFILSWCQTEVDVM